MYTRGINKYAADISRIEFKYQNNEWLNLPLFILSSFDERNLWKYVICIFGMEY